MAQSPPLPEAELGFLGFSGAPSPLQSEEAEMKDALSFSYKSEQRVVPASLGTRAAPARLRSGGK